MLAGYLMIYHKCYIMINECKYTSCMQGWGAGAAWKKKSGAGAGKKLAGSSALPICVPFV